MERCRKVAQHPNVYTMSVVPQWFDVLPKGVSKLTGFETLLERAFLQGCLFLEMAGATLNF